MPPDETQLSPERAPFPLLLDDVLIRYPALAEFSVKCAARKDVALTWVSIIGRILSSHDEAATPSCERARLCDKENSGETFTLSGFTTACERTPIFRHVERYSGRTRVGSILTYR